MIWECFKGTDVKGRCEHRCKLTHKWNHTKKKCERACTKENEYFMHGPTPGSGQCAKCEFDQKWDEKKKQCVRACNAQKKGHGKPYVPRDKKWDPSDRVVHAVV